MRLAKPTGKQDAASSPTVAESSAIRDILPSRIGF